MTGNVLVPDAGQRAQALDPRGSYIVQAPAGSGKTTLLAQRYVGLLERVQRPEEILAITFTRKAAAEMRHRVLTLLQQDTPQARTIRVRDHAEGWQLFSNPNVLKIQTIDSFALEIASQTPFLENAAGLSITPFAAQYYQQAAAQLLGKLYEDGPSNALIGEFLAFLDNDADKAIRLLSHMLGRRDQWLAPVTAIATGNDPELTARLLSDAIDSLRHDIRRQLQARFNQDDLHMLTTLADILDIADDWDMLFPILLTKSGALRKRLTVKDGISNAERKRAFNQWLETLRERQLESLIISFTHTPDEKLLPPSASSEEQLHTLHLCCVCLALAAIELDELLSAAGEVDFTGLLLRAKTALRDDQGPSDLALYLDYRIHHILVDEYQDTSRAQFEFFKLLTEGWQTDGETTFFAVGDPMQSIYRFRDADVSIFADSRDHGLADLPLTECTLEANFRSDPVIVNWCNSLFETLFGERNATALGEVSFSAATPMIPAQAKIIDPGVQCSRFIETRNETLGIVAHVQKLIAANGDESIAVLCRARGHLKPLLNAFTNLGIQVQATDMDLLSSRPVIRDLMSLHGILLRPSDRLAWFSLLRSPMFGLDLAELTQFSDVVDFEDTVMIRQHDIDRLDRLRVALIWARSRLYEVPLREVLEGMWFRCGGSDAYPHDQWRHAIAWFSLLDELQTQAYEQAALEHALESLYAASERQARVQIMTIHKAKGLEFDHVILPYLERRARSDTAQLLLWRAGTTGLLMGVRGDAVHHWLAYEERQRSINEEKRLLYVACTRAKQTLYTSFSCAVDAKPGGLAKWLAPVAGQPTLQSHEPMPRAERDKNDLFENQYLERLPAAYEWRVPAYKGLSDHVDESIAHADQISSRYEVALGLLVHRALAWCAHPRLKSVETSALTDRLTAQHLKRWASELALDTTEYPHLLDACIVQLRQTMQDQQGRWLLRDHPHAHSEWPMTGIYGDEITRVILDRTFVDKGTRWIIDYKTGRPQNSEDQDAFIAREVARYAPQLRKYREICASVYPQPITTALYFTALSHLQNVN